MRNQLTEETETPHTSIGIWQDVDIARSRKQTLSAFIDVEDWLAAGFVTIPKTKADVRLAFAARACVQGLSCFSDVRERLVAGERFPRIAGSIFNSAVPAPSVKRSTLIKYLAGYRRFFVRLPVCNPDPGEVVTADPAESDVTRTFDFAEATGITEVDFLRGLLRVQQRRIQSLLGPNLGFAHSEFIHREIREARETAVKLAEMKLNLGIYNATTGIRSPAISQQKLDQLSPASKEALIRLGTLLDGLCVPQTDETRLR